jgi:hypothetical protein
MASAVGLASTDASRRFRSRISWLTVGRPPRDRDRPTPIEAEAGAMPADDRFRLHEHKHVFPTPPSLLQHGPEQPVESVQRRPGPFPLQDGQLRAKREDLERNFGAAAEEDAGGGKQCEDDSLAVRHCPHRSGCRGWAV